MTRLALFDFDGTLSRGDSVVPFLLFAIRRGWAKRSLLPRSVHAWAKQLRNPGKVVSAKETSLSFLKGRTVEEADAFARDFLREKIAARLFPEGKKELERLKREGYVIVLVSASADAYMRLIPELLPVDAVLATECLTENGRYTGRIRANCRGEEKPRRIQSWLEERNLQPDWENSRAYGDSASDAPMLRMVGHPVLVNPGKKLRELLPGADAVGW